jgi:hypothetical protein
MGVRSLALAKPKPKVTGPDVEQQLVELTNSSRQAEGLPNKLIVRSDLTEVARDYAKKISQTPTDYSKPLAEQWTPPQQWMEEELRSSGYGWPVMTLRLLPQVFRRTADGHRLSVPDAFATWLEEDRSKAQPARGILSPFVADFGVGVYHDEATGFYYVSFVFAKRFRTMELNDLFAPKDKEKDKDGQ